MSEAMNGEFDPGPSVTAGGGWLTPRELFLLLVLASVQFTHIVDFVIIMPLGPVFELEMELEQWEFGLVVAAYTISAGLASLLAARFLDRFDRKTALLGLYGGFAVGTLACAIAPNFPFLLAARTVAGAFGGVVGALVLAIVGDAFHDARRGTAMGVVMSAFSLALIAGIPLGLLLAENAGWRSTFAVLGGFSACVLVLAALALPSLRGHLKKDQPDLTDHWAVLTNPNHLQAYVLTVAIFISSFMLAPHLPTYLVANVGMKQPELKYMYLWGGLATLLTMTLFGRLADRFGKLLVFRILALFTVVPIAAVTNLPAQMSLVLILLITTMFMVTTSGRMVPAMALIAGSSAPAYRGSFMSLNSAVQQLTAGLATLISGFLLHKEVGGPLEGFSMVGVFACAATVASVFLAGRLRKDPGDLAPDSPAVEDSLAESVHV